MGQPSFSEIILSSTDIDRATSVYAVDMDNDGDIDLVSGGSGDAGIGWVSWFENNGNESFTARTIATSNDGKTSVYAIDVDSDGDMDVLSASLDDNKIAWYENNGSQSFTARTITTSANSAEDVYAIDVDGDGDIDVLSADNQKIAWYENNGSESFTARTIFALSYANTVRAIDLDSDGDIDVISGQMGENNGTKHLMWYKNNGSQSFTVHTIESTTNVYSLDLIDFDFDGDIDIVAAGANQYHHPHEKDERSVYWYENNGSESFTRNNLSDAIISTTYDSGTSVYARDMDNDGDIDAISSGLHGTGVVWHENIGSKTKFTTRGINHIYPGSNSSSTYDTYPIDLDNDGDLDMLAAHFISNSTEVNPSITWIKNTLDLGQIASWSTSTISTVAYDPQAVFMADLDNDGDLDILSASANDDGIAWYENDGNENPGFTHSKISNTPNSSLFVADMDRDGDLDIVGSTAWYENDGNANPSFSKVAISNLTATALFVADMDRDGDMDIVSVVDDADEVSFFENDGNPDPSWSKTIIEKPGTTGVYPNGPVSCFVNDINKDGALDIIVSARQSGNVRYYYNEGNKSWTLKKIIANIPGGHSDVFVSDIDQDGDLDIVSSTMSNNSSGAINLHENNYDDIVPTISSVSSTVDNGAYKVGDVIPISVNWNEAATVTGAPRIKLETGTTDQYATYTSGTGTTTLTFNYTVAAGDTTADLDYTSTSALELNSGTIKDASGNVATLTLASPGASGSLGANKAIVIDGNVPTISSVSSTKANGGYTVGDTIPITITFTQTVTIKVGNTAVEPLPGTDGSPYIFLPQIPRDVFYTSGSGTNILRFDYIIAAGQNSSDLSYTTTNKLAIWGTGGSIQDASGNDASLTLPTSGESGSLSANKNLIIDTTSPKVTTVSSNKANAAYKVGELIPINVFFDDKVYVTGTPQLTLETGDTDAIVDYVSGSQDSTITFNYTVASTHNSGDLDYTSASALVLNSGTVMDSLGNAAILTLPAPGATGSFGANKAIIIDNLPPTVTLDPADGSTAVLPTLPISINFNEYVRFLDNSQATSANVDALITLKDTNADGSDIAFDATINTAKTKISIDPTTDFSSEQTVYFAISASLEDSLDHATSAASATLKMKDVIVPTVAFDPTNGSTDVPGNRNITLTFSESIRNIDNSEITDENVADLVVLKGNSPSGADFNFGATINMDKTAITIDPLFDFSASSVVYVSIGAVVEDDADNAIESSSVIFITGIPDVIGPAVSNITSTKSNGTYTAKDTIIISIDFNEVSIVEGTPQLILETGTTDGVANYSTGSGTKTLFFIYVITDQHNIDDLDYASDNSLTLNDGSIKDFVGNNANLALPNPGAEGSLGANKDIVIDNIGPSVTSISSTTEDGVYKAGEVIIITVSLNENTIVTGSPQITLETGATDGVGVYSSGSGGKVLSFNYTVDASHNTPDLAYVSTTALALNGGTMKDMVGLNADLTLPTPGVAGSLSSNKNISIDNISPTITTTSIEDNGTLSVIADSKITFTTSEGISSAKMELSSKLGDSVSGQLTIDDATHASANLNSPFTSGDELTLTINELTDYAGNVTNGLVYNYNIALIADYNVDGSINAADMTVLIDGWSNKDYAFELGPTTGDVPNLKPSLDGKFDIMDAAVLIRMWHWNLNKSGKILSRYINTGKEIEYINENNTLSINVSDNVNAMDLIFIYPQEKIKMNQYDESASDKEIILSHMDTLSGEYLITAGYLEQKKRTLHLPYLIKGREDIAVTAIYRMFDNNGDIIGQGTREITLKAVPQEFSLHQNYPNPFNPLTTINYDLPSRSRVNLVIYDIMGREVVTLLNEERNEGYHSIIWNTRNNVGTPVSAGIYFYHIQAKDFVKTRKMVLIK